MRTACPPVCGRPRVAFETLAKFSDRCDSFHLQSTLAHRALVLFARLFREDGSSRRLPRKIRTAPGNLRSRAACPPVETKIDMVARSQCRRSQYCVETSQRIAGVRARLALRFDNDHDNRIRPRQPKRPILDGSHVHAARLLANNATRVFCHSSSPDRSG